VDSNLASNTPDRVEERGNRHETISDIERGLLSLVAGFEVYIGVIFSLQTKLQAIWKEEKEKGR
jgi:hypothetical protein